MTEWQITEAMIVYGGGFVSDLGKLYRRADAVNKLRLKEAFRDYFAEYAELAKLKAAAEAKR